MRRFWNAIRRPAVVTVAVLAVVVPACTGTHAAPNALSGVRTATARFHDLQAARGAGYRPVLSCFDSPAGGMGQHYARVDQFDNHLDPLQPEAMVYEVGRDRSLQLVAVEYIVPQKGWTAATPPVLLGQTFSRNNALGLWVLHAWIWRTNPAGMFANYNPAVPKCPGH